ncbi:hypothetical protein [Nocardia sp. NPDC057668]|uniref:hypothetical protein n=1 Tax=Nocardia sp. NPDC057668 TaxID=3346202 RepID=UPI00366B2E8B
MTIESIPAGEPLRIGPYRLLGVLESGPGFRCVLGVGPDGGVHVVRQAGGPQLNEPGFRLRWRRDALAAMRVAGAGNTAVVDVDADDEYPWRSTLFVASARLDGVLDRHRSLPEPAVLALATGLAAALRDVHAAGLVHGRVRPDTVALTRQGVRLAEAVPATGGAVESVCPAPELNGGADHTVASDVFALGVVLAAAASGRDPFARTPARGVRPDLRDVPEPLRTVIAACLREDPAGRPTPEQILDYLGPATTAAAWPVSVLNAIDAQEREAAELAGTQATTATSGEPRAWRSALAAAAGATTEFGERSVRAIRTRTGDTTGQIQAVVGLTLVVVTIATLVLAVRDGGDSTDPAPEPVAVSGLSLDESRRIDACRWLGDALGGSVPVAPTPQPAAAWKTAVTAGWGCRAAAAGYELELQLGTQLAGFTPEETVLDGIRLRHGAGERCARAIAAPAPEDAAGVTVELRLPAGVKDCRGLEYVAANLVRTFATAPGANRPDTALAVLAPCDLLTREVVTKAIGPTPAQPSVADAHSCVWDGGLELTVRASQSGRYTGGPDTAVVEGVRMFLDTPAAADTCTREYLVPNSGTDTVAVTVRWTEGTRESNCPIAEAMLRTVVARLPGR